MLMMTLLAGLRCSSFSLYMILTSSLIRLKFHRRAMSFNLFYSRFSAFFSNILLSFMVADKVSFSLAAPPSFAFTSWNCGITPAKKTTHSITFVDAPWSLNLWTDFPANESLYIPTIHSVFQSNISLVCRYPSPEVTCSTTSLAHATFSGLASTCL